MNLFCKIIVSISILMTAGISANAAGKKKLKIDLCGQLFAINASKAEIDEPQMGDLIYVEAVKAPFYKADAKLIYVERSGYMRETGLGMDLFTIVGPEVDSDGNLADDQSSVHLATSGKYGPERFIYIGKAKETAVVTEYNQFYEQRLSIYARHIKKGDVVSFKAGAYAVVDVKDEKVAGDLGDTSIERTLSLRKIQRGRGGQLILNSKIETSTFGEGYGLAKKAYRIGHATWERHIRVVN